MVKRPIEEVEVMPTDVEQRHYLSAEASNGRSVSGTATRVVVLFVQIVPSHCQVLNCASLAGLLT